MNPTIAALGNFPKQDAHQYQPIFFRLTNEVDYNNLKLLFDESRILFVHDNINGQLKELIKCRNVGIKLNNEDYLQKIEQLLAGLEIDKYGVWIFYPWSGRLVHTLDEEEFIEIRTNRNQYKITRAERDVLARKKIGVVGLSVGQSVALTLAMERVCGHLVLADFDELELSNLNRIRTGIQNLGLSKVIVAAREIAEIDPYLKVTCYTEGLTQENMDHFFTHDGLLDLLVEECDGLDMKIAARKRAKELRIPVIMDTSDRGMLDVERFDLEPKRPLLHGLVDDLELQDVGKLSDEDKVPVILQMLGLEEISLRGKVSMIEVNQTINTWPQLASSVTLGGALVTDVGRRILLNQFQDSGRYYLDLEELIAGKNNIGKQHVPLPRNIAFLPLTLEQMEQISNDYFSIFECAEELENSKIMKMVEAACAAPSTGNDQPWKWLYKKGVLFLFHDEYRSASFGDFQKIASFLSFGAAYENLSICAQAHFGLVSEYNLFPIPKEQKLVAAIRFSGQSQTSGIEMHSIHSLSNVIFKRNTNRNNSTKVALEQSVLTQLKNITQSIPGACFQYTTDEGSIAQLGKIIGACDKIRIFNDEGHQDFAQREMRWTEEQAKQTRDGIFIKTLGLSNAQLAALRVIKNHEVIRILRDLGGGNAFDSLALKGLSNASAMIFLSMPKYDLGNFFEGGRSMERLWLEATRLGLAVHPMISPLYLFPRVLHANDEGISEQNAQELRQLRARFASIFKLDDDGADIFLTKIAKAPDPEMLTFRLPLDHVLFLSSDN